jgi:phenylacetate-CoA ligase
VATSPLSGPVWNAEDEPLLTDSDRRFLLSLREHPCAPFFNYACGEMLDSQGLEWVRYFEETLKRLPPRWRPSQPPEWVFEFARRCLSQVPLYVEYGQAEWSPALPCLTRAALHDRYQDLIPADMPRDDLVLYYTSGTTGNSMQIPSHPVTAGCYLPLLRKAVESRGGQLRGGAGRVSIMLVFYQRNTLTYPSISRVLDGGAFLKLNLHESQWSSPQHRATYLHTFQPEVLSGNPLSLGELARLEIRLRPSAVISTSMALLPGARRELEECFECPVIDLYSMTECRCVAAHGGDDRYDLLAHDVYVEILDSQGRVCPPGERGEITLSGGRNPFQPLLRYRTGDFAAMRWDQDIPYLVGLGGRAPVRYYRSDRTWVNNIDVTGVLQDLPLRRFSLHQRTDLSLRFQVQVGPAVCLPTIEARLRSLLGSDLNLEVVAAAPGELLENKWMNYTSDLADG